MSINPLISIIIPVYKAEKYINRCLDSIIAQTYTNWEAILIDDGSPDSSGAICDEYATKDTRFKVIHQRNEGVSSARNRGIEMAEGEWITFVDSDDYVEENYISDLQKGIIPGPCLVIQGHNLLVNGHIHRTITFNNEIVTRNEFSKLLGKKRIFEYGHSCAKLYNKEIIKKGNITFNNKLSYSEDLIFMLEYIYYCNSVNYISNANYNYISNISSLSNRYNSFDKEYLLYKEFKRINLQISDKFGFEETEESKLCGGIILIRSILALYLHKKKSYSYKERIECLKLIKRENKKYFQEYYKPQITLFKILKQIFLLNIRLFDLICIYKFG